MKTGWEILKQGEKDIDESALPDDQKLHMKTELLNMVTVHNILDRIDDRRKNAKIAGKYGVTFLDDCLRGIMPDDFVLIGADTGAGKSALAYEIAFSNSLDKNVHLLALECDEDEPFMRKQYSFISDLYYKKYNRSLSYADYIIGDDRIKAEIEEFVPAARLEMKKYKNLTIHYRGKGFGVKDLLDKVSEISHQSGLIIVDHVDYFDLNLQENENAQVSEIMKVLRSINLDYHIPIIVISHLRKKQNRKQIMPSVDDFMGTSNKAKQAKTVILLARNYEADNYDKYRYGTFCHVAKCRLMPSVNLVGMLTFDGIRRQYEEKYELGRIVSCGEKVEVESYDRYPSWIPEAHIKRSPSDDRSFVRNFIDEEDE